MANTLLAVLAGLVLAVSYGASPLTVCALAITPAFFAWAGRDLPPHERRVVFAILGVALAARVVLIGAMFLAGIRDHNDLSIGALRGDESYYLSRAIRARDIVLGLAEGKYDSFIVTDEYGRTSYLTLLTRIQILFGPTPYSMRLVNALLFTAGTVLLFRIARPAFGLLAATLGLTTVLLMPSLMVSSVSLLKESLYFFLTCALLTCTFRIVRTRGWLNGSMAFAIGAVCVWLLNDLRRGAVVLSCGGLALGFALRFIGGFRWRMAGVAILAVAAMSVVVLEPTLRTRAVDRVTSLAKIHSGHVFTVGHAYKLMDDGFYIYPEAPGAWNLRLTAPQAARFLFRAGVSFILTPVPWEMRSRSELLFLPEHLIWYLTVMLLPVGLVAGWKRDPLVSAMLIGFAIPTAAVLALTNGNIGTLLRLRGLVTPYLFWLSAFGLCVIAESMVSKGGSAVSASGRLGSESPHL